MNSLEFVKDQISAIVPGATFELDPSETPTGSSWLDIRTDEQLLTVEFKKPFGFGLYSSSENSFGSGPNEIYRSVDSLIKRVRMLLVEQRVGLKLKEIRELLGKTQEEYSEISGRNQSSVSKLENRADLQFSSIDRFVKDLGGWLEVKVHFEEFDAPMSLSSVQAAANKSLQRTFDPPPAPLPRRGRRLKRR